MPNGYIGRILHIDLTRAKLTVEEPDEWFYRMYLGGQGIGMYYVLKQMSPGTDPLDPENVLAITLGIAFDPDDAYDERREVYKMSGKIVRTQATVQTAEGDKNGLWTTVIAGAVFLM